MRIFSGIIAAALMVWACAAHTQEATAPPGQYASAQAALERGLGAFRTGKHEIAIPALSAAAAMGNSSARFVAEFYLARIYAADAGPTKDLAKAFVLYRKLADEKSHH